MEASNRRRGRGRGQGRRKEEVKVNNGQEDKKVGRTFQEASAQIQVRFSSSFCHVECCLSPLLSNPGIRLRRCVFDALVFFFQANLQRHLAQQMSNKESVASFSDESEDDDDVEEESRGEAASQELLGKVFDSYDLGGEGERTRQAILLAFQKGQSACLICISSIKWVAGNRL